jgi:hypothetical protein
LPENPHYPWIGFPGERQKHPDMVMIFFLGVVQLSGAGHADRPLNEGEVKK